jgi:hypothetical protein
MRRTKITVIAISLITGAALLTACGNLGSGNAGTADTPSTSLENVAEIELNSDGTYTPKSGDRYVGIRIEFEDGNDWQFYTICKGDTVVDCGVNSAMAEYTIKEDYIGKNYKDAFVDFYNFHSQYEDHGDVAEIQIMNPDGADAEDEYADVLAEVAKKIAPKAKTGYMGEDKDRFIERIGIYTESYAWEISEERREKEREEEAAAEEERKRKEEEERRLAEEALEAERNTPVSSAAEIRKRLDKGIDSAILGSDIVIDVSSDTLEGIYIECEGHAVTIKGTWPKVAPGRDGRSGIELMNAGKVDMSGLTINGETFTDEEWVRNGYEFVRMRDTNYKNVTFPSGLVPNEPPEVAPFEGCVCCGIEDDGMNENLGYMGPSVTYEEQKELETKVVTAILTEGDADNVEGAYDGDFAVWTNLEIDVGNTVLPNQDYQFLTLKPGSSLKITGTIALTGGRLGWRVTEASQLDINGLTLTKKHPSPDMVKIEYNPSAGLDTSLLNCKASSGTIKFDLSDTGYSITIW